MTPILRTLTRLCGIAVLSLTAGCVMTGGPGAGRVSGVYPLSGKPLPAGLPLVTVAARMEPVAEFACAEARPHAVCDFVIAVDDDPSQPPNAFQTFDSDGRPVIVFTWALLQAARNSDELAFVLGHEAAHHIAGHIAKREVEARAGAVQAATLARTAGMTGAAVRRAAAAGAQVGAQRYSIEYELEADALGARLAWEAGFDPMRGAAFFLRLPDPMDHAMSSHPPNAARRAVVQAVVAELEGR
ncbi:M48 family metallopeptidase [Neotabrizicola sp. VNH66]|uniref:M48 family metallopeptidase n=1 Tax=Neotabrizicola sp. VNH66 TaxID=3400918 RepID=UPI003C03ED41